MVCQCKRKVAFFTAMCLFCSMLELIIPKPTFIRIGFSNLPIMLSLYCEFSTGQYALLVILRILAQGLINGTIISYSFVLSAAAGLSSAICTFVLFKTKKFNFSSISVASAFVSNLCQISLSSVFLGKGVFSLAPFILGVGLFTSFCLGFCTDYFIKHSSFTESFCNAARFETSSCESLNSRKNKFSCKRLVKVVFGSASILTCYFSSELIVTAISAAFLLLACTVSGRKLKIMPILWLMFRTVLINVLLPNGKVLFSIGTFSITQDSLRLGIHRSLILLSSIWFSKWIIPKKDELEEVFKPDSIFYMVFEYFKIITENWKKVDKGHNLLQRVDNTLVYSVGMKND